MKKLIIMKDGYNGLTDSNPSHMKFSSDYGTLKYETKQVVTVTIPGGDTEAYGSYTHSLGYYPFIEVYVSVNSDPAYEYCPSHNSGASVGYGSSYIVDSTKVNLFAYNTGAFSDMTFRFIIFLYKNNLGF